MKKLIYVLICILFCIIGLVVCHYFNLPLNLIIFIMYHFGIFVGYCIGFGVGISMK